MKTAAALLIVFVFTQACREKGNETLVVPAKKQTNSTQLSQENVRKPYLTAPLMVTDNNNNRDMASAAAKFNSNVYRKKAVDPACNWSCMDACFKNEMPQNTTDRQYLAFTILAKKDLIGETPSPETDIIKKKYISELVNTSYKGYCVLYYALQSLTDNAENKNFIAEAKTRILNSYAANTDIKHFLSLDLDQVADPHQKKMFQKIKQNYGYIEQIGTL